jgi:hypothetical protein
LPIVFSRNIMHQPSALIIYRSVAESLIMPQISKQDLE